MSLENSTIKDLAVKSSLNVRLIDKGNEIAIFLAMKSENFLSNGSTL